MGFTADIDTGGTFTDGLFTDGTVIMRAKVDTTPHDLTVAWINCLRQGAAQFGYSTIREFLEQVDIMRWSSTVATNVIAERKGPKLGLFVSQGQQKSLYSKSPKSPAVGLLVDESNIEGVLAPLDTEALLLRIRHLLEHGVRRICVSLPDALRRDEEKKIKEVFEEQYPDHYLGNVPLLLGGDILKHDDDMTRTHMALMNSYVHGPMAVTMFKAEDELRGRGFLKPLLVGHIDGGVARVSKTKPVETIESGPIFGIHAGAYWAKVYELPLVITLDVGGTTTKVGLVEDFKPAVTREPEIFGVPLKQTMLDLRSIALGGGSVAKADGKHVRLGPRSMGAYPGPACYGLGGTEATLTDAYVTNGFIDPAYFAGGAKKLDSSRAEKAIADNVAGPLGLDLQMAAYKIASTATDMVAQELSRLIARTKRSPSEYALFAFGGNGGVLGLEAAKKAGVDKAYLFSYGSVFSAFGSAVADVSHTYERSASVSLAESDQLAQAVAGMAEEARLDMEGEGFSLAKVTAELDLVLYDSSDREKVFQATIPWEISANQEQPPIKPSVDESELGAAAGRLIIELVRLRVRAPLSKLELSAGMDQGEDASAALTKEREVWRGSEKVCFGVYDWGKLNPGNVVKGPAILEGRDTTYVVNRGWELVIDRYHNGRLARRA
jgi:N-methylhydantoinase A/oxoprolinase/acetone carboxylase beta subunit